MPHPKVMTIQPECSAFDLRSSTPATTPSPRSMRIKVPTNSAMYGCTWYSFLKWAARRRTVWRRKAPLLLAYRVGGVECLFHNIPPPHTLAGILQRGGSCLFVDPVLRALDGLLPLFVQPLALLLVHLGLVAARELPLGVELLAAFPEAGREPRQVRRSQSG